LDTVVMLTPASAAISFSVTMLFSDIFSACFSRREGSRRNSSYFTFSFLISQYSDTGKAEAKWIASARESLDYSSSAR
jgi:hypothetical protein